MQTASSTDAPRAEHDWRSAGAAWGSRSRDWAYLAESGAARVYETVLDRVAAGARTRMLDVACGAGGALVAAARRGVDLAGIDAADDLTRIARRRLPNADIRLGTMFELPFDDASFDVVTSFNGIWSGNEHALREVRRVVRRGGRVAITFWEISAASEHLHVIAELLRLQPEPSAEAAVRLSDISAPGVAEDMFARAGLVPRERGTAPVVHEWPDVEIACRALLSSGPAWAAIACSGEAVVRAAVSAALEPYTDEFGVRLCSNYQYVVADA